MHSTSSRYPLIKLPDDVERILFLIREELKLIRFFRVLADAGLSDPYIRPCLDSLILRELEHALHAYEAVYAAKATLVQVKTKE